MSETKRKKHILRRIVNFPFVALILFYRRFLSPLFPPACRFFPSCSAYGLEAFQTHPFFKALWLTAWRIMRCNPFNPGGYDPVPPPAGQTVPETGGAPRSCSHD